MFNGPKIKQNRIHKIDVRLNGHGEKSQNREREKMKEKRVFVMIHIISIIISPEVNLVVYVCM